MKITVDAEVELDDVLETLTDGEILERFTEDELIYELENRGELDTALLEKFSDENILYEISSRSLDDKLVQNLDAYGLLDDYKSLSLEYYGLTTNLEKEKLQRYLCDALDLGYHTNIDAITSLLNTKLNERI